jgi:predicted oxidoreductase
MFRILLGLLFAVDLLRAAPQAPDVVIVGAGIAGLTTALEAARGGAIVDVIDVASVFGGHAVVSEGGLALVGTPLQEKLGVKDSPGLAYDDILRWGGDANTEWARIYVDRSRRDIYAWMTDLGVSFDGLILVAGNSAARFHTNPRRGYGLVEPVYRECLRSGRVRFHWNTRITRLTREAGRITGVEGANERTGAPFHLSGEAIVLATGGFQSNLAMVKEYWPPQLPFPEKILIGSGINAVGSGLELARGAGAAIDRLDHQWNYPRGIPDPRYPGSNRGLHMLNAVAMWVNANGERFQNEAAGSHLLLKQMLNQPGGRAWMVFDAEGRKAMTIAGTDWADPRRVDALVLKNPELVNTANRLEELAQKSGWPVAKFLETAARFNRDLQSGVDSAFDWFNPRNPPAARVGRAAIPPLAVPPFYAVPLYAMTRKSLGGVVVDLECRVLNPQRQPVTNLYAVGEVTGFNGLNGKAGLEGTFLGPSILQGRILGQKLAKGIQARAVPAGPVAARSAPQTPAPPRVQCQSCHPVDKLVATPRKGYWHFERVHKRVLENSWQCETCHAELSPFAAERHRTNPISQIAACARCHLNGT